MTLALITTAQQSAPVTNWPARLALTALTLLVILAIAWLMLRGWRRRAARQADLPDLPPRPDALGATLLPPVEGTYVSSTTSGSWLDRIVVRDLGVPSAATVHTTAAGLSFDRAGASDVFVPAAWLRGVRWDRGMAGKYVEGSGLVVFTWELGDRLLDTGFRARRAAEGAALVEAAERLVVRGSAS